MKPLKTLDCSRTYLSTSAKEVFTSGLELFGVSTHKWDMGDLFFDAESIMKFFKGDREHSTIYWSMDKESGSTRLDFESAEYVKGYGEDFMIALKIVLDWEKMEITFFQM